MHPLPKILLAGGLALLGSQAAQAQQLLDNYENTRLVNYPAMQGSLKNVSNPGSDGPNPSATCARYVRDGSQYAYINVQPKSGKFANVAPYVAGTKKMTLRFRSSQPAGTPVQLVLQNQAKVAAQPYTYPQGNLAGIYAATTTAAPNTWETLTFTLMPAPGDPTVTAADIDQLALFVAVGTTSTATYYFDDLTGPELSSAK